jgi:hypothetical protein
MNKVPSWYLPTDPQTPEFALQPSGIFVPDANHPDGLRELTIVEAACEFASLHAHKQNHARGVAMASLPPTAAAPLAVKDTQPAPADRKVSPAGTAGELHPLWAKAISDMNGAR